MQHLHAGPKKQASLPESCTFQARVRFLAYHRIKPHVPPLVRAPVNSFEFHRCRRTPQVEYLTLSLYHSGIILPEQLVFIVYCVDYQGI